MPQILKRLGTLSKIPKSKHRLWAFLGLTHGYPKLIQKGFQEKEKENKEI